MSTKPALRTKRVCSIVSSPREQYPRRSPVVSLRHPESFSGLLLCSSRTMSIFHPPSHRVNSIWVRPRGRVSKYALVSERRVAWRQISLGVPRASCTHLRTPPANRCPCRRPVSARLCTQTWPDGLGRRL